MASNSRALRLIRTLENYTLKSNSFDSVFVLKKIKLVSASDGFLKGMFTVEEAMCNPGGTVHGGYIASIIDTLCFYSQLTLRDCKIGWTTNMNVTYLTPAKIGEQISVESKMLKMGNMSASEASLTNESGVLVAKGVISFKAGTNAIQKFVHNVLNFNENDKID